ncbi:hypothetical protein [Caulobacter sp. LARHSG274]
MKILIVIGGIFVLVGGVLIFAGAFSPHGPAIADFEDTVGKREALIYESKGDGERLLLYRYKKEKDAPCLAGDIDKDLRGYAKIVSRYGLHGDVCLNIVKKNYSGSDLYVRNNEIVAFYSYW